MSRSPQVTAGVRTTNPSVLKRNNRKSSALFMHQSLANVAGRSTQCFGVSSRARTHGCTPCPLCPRSASPRLCDRPHHLVSARHHLRDVAALFGRHLGQHHAGPFESTLQGAFSCEIPSGKRVAMVASEMNGLGFGHDQTTWSRPGDDLKVQAGRRSHGWRARHRGGSRARSNKPLHPTACGTSLLPRISGHRIAHFELFEPPAAGERRR